MPGCIYPVDRIVSAIGIKVQAIDGVWVKVADVVNRDESSDFGVVVTALQKIEIRLGIVVIATVPEGIQVADVVGVGNLGSACIENLTIAPRIIAIFYHNRAAAVKQESHVILRVLSTIIGAAAMLDGKNTCVVVEKLQAVALFDQISGRIIAECEVIFLCPSTSRIIGESVAVKCRKLSAKLPCGGFAAIGGRVADCVIRECLAAVCHQLIAVFGVAVCGADAVQQVQLRGGFCCQRIFVFGKDVAVVVVGIGSGLARLRVVLAGQSAESVILIAAGGTAVFHDLHDIAHAVIAILHNIVSAPQLGQHSRRVCLARAALLIKNQTAEAVWKNYFFIILSWKSVSNSCNVPI